VSPGRADHARHNAHLVAAIHHYERQRALRVVKESGKPAFTESVKPP